MATSKLKILQKVNSMQTASDSIVIPNNKIARLYYFYASVPDSAKAACTIEWDGALKWVIQRQGSMPEVGIFEVVGDGVKSLSMIARNECDNDYYYTAIALINIED